MKNQAREESESVERKRKGKRKKRREREKWQKEGWKGRKRFHSRCEMTRREKAKLITVLNLAGMQVGLKTKQTGKQQRRQKK